MVVNGATKAKDMQHFDARLKQFGGDVKYTYFPRQNLVALQGPAASSVLTRLVDEKDRNTVATMRFMTGRP